MSEVNDLGVTPDFYQKVDDEVATTKVVGGKPVMPTLPGGQSIIGYLSKPKPQGGEDAKMVFEITDRDGDGLALIMSEGAVVRLLERLRDGLNSLRAMNESGGRS